MTIKAKIGYTHNGEGLQYKRLMGVDYGDRRVGIALSDPLCIISSAYEVYQSKGEDDAISHISDLVKQFNVSDIAFGLPLNLDGSEGERALIHKAIGQKLEQISGAKVHFIDERLTSSEAEDYLKEARIDWKKRKEVIDKISAQIILQTYMNSKN